MIIASWDRAGQKKGRALGQAGRACGASPTRFCPAIPETASVRGMRDESNVIVHSALSCSCGVAFAYTECTFLLPPYAPEGKLRSRRLFGAIM